MLLQFYKTFSDFPFLYHNVKGRFPEGGYLEVRSVSGFPPPSRLQK